MKYTKEMHAELERLAAAPEFKNDGWTLEETPNIGAEVDGCSLGYLFSECARTGWREYIDFMPGGKVFFSGAYSEVFKDGEIIHYHQTAQMLTPRQLLLVLVAAEKIAAMTAEEEGEQGHE